MKVDVVAHSRNYSTLQGLLLATQEVAVGSVICENLEIVKFLEK
jgi:hypothetical protein